MNLGQLGCQLLDEALFIHRRVLGVALDVFHNKVRKRQDGARCIEQERRRCCNLTDSPSWRIRIGDWRAIYGIDDAAQVMTILRIKHRRDVYRDL